MSLSLWLLTTSGNTHAPTAAAVSHYTSTSDRGHIRSESEHLTSEAIVSLAEQYPSIAGRIDFGRGVNPLSHTIRVYRSTTREEECKVFPGDDDWPSDQEWSEFNQTIGGALIKTVPLAAPCYNSWPEQRDPKKCADVIKMWNKPLYQTSDPASVDWPLFQGRTCMPTDNPEGSCTVGGYPTYVVDGSTVANIQLAVNFARNSNLRLNIKNTGHDYNAKSTGAGALSIWTHHLNSLEYIPHYPYASSGPAFKIGAGVLLNDLYQAAEREGLSIVGGIARTIGLAGGYIAAAGHSPLSSLHGLGADQVLSLEVVLPNGTFVSVNKDQNQDLFWAMRGGGGSTFGVVTSAVIRAYPSVPVASVSYNFTSGGNVSADTFWKGMRAFWETFIPNVDAGHYQYFKLTCSNDDSSECIFILYTHWANGMIKADLEQWNAPLFARLSELGIPVQGLTTKEFSSFYPAYNWAFPEPAERVGTWAAHTGSRLFPRKNFEGAGLDETHETIRWSIENGGKMLGFQLKAAENGGVDQDNAVHPAWRDSVILALMATPWPANSSDPVIVEYNKKLIRVMQSWRDVTPGSGCYMNEADINEPGYIDSFYGRHYPRLYELKQKHDPWGLLYAATAVGAEDWYITDQIPLLPTQNGRLCRKREVL